MHFRSGSLVGSVGPGLQVHNSRFVVALSSPAQFHGTTRSMSIYDLVMLIVFAAAVFFGLWKGLAWQVASLAAVFVSYFVAIQFRGVVAPMIQAEEPWNRFAAMLILYLGTSLVIWLVYGRVSATIRRLKLKSFDRQAGAILGAAKGAILCMLVTLFSVSLLGDSARDAIVQSRSGGLIAGAINRMDSVMPREIHVYLDKYIEEFRNRMTEVDPTFMEQGEQELDQALQTFKGQWSEPGEPPPFLQQQGSGWGIPSGTETGKRLEGSANDFLNSVRNDWDRSIENLKRDGQSAIRDGLNRAADEAAEAILGSNPRK